MPHEQSVRSLTTVFAAIADRRGPKRRLIDVITLPTFRDASGFEYVRTELKMRGTLRISAGRFALDTDVTLSIWLCDAGTHIAVEDRLAGNVYEAMLDATGGVQSIVTRGLSRPLVAQLVRGGKFRRQLPAGRRTLMPSTNIKFHIRYGPRKRPRNSARVIAAFTDYKDLHILYRVTGGGIVYHEDQLAVTRTHVAIGDQIPIDHRLPNSRWDEFLSLKDGASFVLDREWRKMPLDEVEAVVGGRTFQVTTSQRGKC